MNDLLHFIRYEAQNMPGRYLFECTSWKVPYNTTVSSQPLQIWEKESAIFLKCGKQRFVSKRKSVTKIPYLIGMHFALCTIHEFSPPRSNGGTNKSLGEGPTLPVVPAFYPSVGWTYRRRHCEENPKGFPPMDT